MNNITYLLGAGASYASMPLLETMKMRLRIFKDFIKHKKRVGQLGDLSIDLFIAGIEEIIKGTEDSTTIDNYANSLFNLNDLLSQRRLRNLKYIISAYFIFEQLPKDNEIFYTDEHDLSIGVIPPVHKKYDDASQVAVKRQFDPRYRSFFNSFLDQNKRKLPNHINILSWNYDLQIEGSYCRDFMCSLELAQSNLNIFPTQGFVSDGSMSKIIKLNGTAGVNLIANNTYGNDISNFKISIVEFLTFTISLFVNSQQYSITIQKFNFAFEDKTMAGKEISEASKIIEKTNKLVIIGYSFPSMNSNIDKFILRNSGHISKVYLQVPAFSKDRVTNNLKRANIDLAGKLEFVDFLDEFYIPH